MALGRGLSLQDAVWKITLRKEYRGVVKDPRISKMKVYSAAAISSIRRLSTVVVYNERPKGREFDGIAKENQ